MSILAILSSCVGLVLYLVGSVGLLIAALKYQGRSAWLVFFIAPLDPLALGFAMLHWRLARWHCLTMLAGFLLIILAIALMPD
jgi:hypothetical protein